MSYMDLDAEAIRGVMPPANRGASDTLLMDYLAEWEVDVTRRFPGDTLPEDDVFLKGILRDLAASSGMKKNATDDEDWQEANRLYESAIQRLGSYDLDASPVSSARLGMLPWV